MKKLLAFIAIAFMVLSCNRSEKIATENRNISEALSPYNGFTVRSKTRYDDRGTCMLQVSNVINNNRYTFYIDSLPISAWDKYDLDDTINETLPNMPIEEQPSTINEDSAGVKTIVIDGIVYEIKEKQ